MTLPWLQSKGPVFSTSYSIRTWHGRGHTMFVYSAILLPNAATAEQLAWLGLHPRLAVSLWLDGSID